MGQAKLRGNLAERHQQALLRIAGEKEIERIRLHEERFALNEWRFANPELAEKERQDNLKVIQTITLLYGMSAMIGSRYTDKLRR